MSMPYTIAICTDCLVWLANGDLPDEDSDFDPSTIIDRDITLGALSSHCTDCANGQCEPWFSWQRCDGCYSPLGGDRHHATEWIDA